MRFSSLLPYCVFTFSVWLPATEESIAPIIRPVTKPDNTEWLAQIERLRLYPRPGSIIGAGISANVVDVYSLNGGEKAEIDKVLGAYNTALLQKAAAWESEIKILHDEYENKIILALPEAQRDRTKQLLQTCLSHWITPFERDAQWTRKFIDHKARLLPKEPLVGDELKAAGAAMRVWISEEKKKAEAKNTELANAIRAMLTPDEIFRIEKYDRNQVLKQGSGVRGEGSEK